VRLKHDTAKKIKDQIPKMAEVQKGQDVPSIIYTTILGDFVPADGEDRNVLAQ
jgi:hypothetical protein